MLLRGSILNQHSVGYDWLASAGDRPPYSTHFLQSVFLVVLTVEAMVDVRKIVIVLSGISFGECGCEWPNVIVKTPTATE